MNSKELNMKLLEKFPEIEEKYLEESSWQDGDNTGSHIIFEDIFVPYAKAKMIKNDKKSLQKIFDYVEAMLEYNDGYTNEVIAYSFFEPLIFDEEIEFSEFIEYAKEKTINMLDEFSETQG